MVAAPQGLLVALAVRIRLPGEEPPAERNKPMNASARASWNLGTVNVSRGADRVYNNQGRLSSSAISSQGVTAIMVAPGKLPCAELRWQSGWAFIFSSFVASFHKPHHDSLDRPNIGSPA